MVKEIKFKLAAKMEELAIGMKPDVYAQIQISERHRNKLNEIVQWINEHEEGFAEGKKMLKQINDEYERGGDPAPK